MVSRVMVYGQKTLRASGFWRKLQCDEQVVEGFTLKGLGFFEALYGDELGCALQRI